MSRARAVLDRVREDRRVRRDFERLMRDNGLAVPGSALRDEEPRTPLRRRSPRWWASRALVAVLTTLVLVASAALLSPLPFDPPAPLQTAFVFDRDGRLIARLATEQERAVVPLRRIPETVRQAFLAAEDERFYRHAGVDPVAVLRAAWNDVTGGPFQGGSTITQQLVRNISRMEPGGYLDDEPYVGRERTLWRKVREAAMAVRLERRFSKDEILEMYLNQIYFGDGAYGVEAASRSYFGVPVRRLDLAQAATLAGIAAGPTRYNPRLDPEAAEARRRWVLARMVTLGFITPRQAAKASAEPIDVAPPSPQESRAAYFVDHLKRTVLRRHGPDLLYRGGLKIETTLDLRLQRAAERAIAGVLDERGDPQAALVSIDVRTGGILAMVGGRDFRRSQVNLATGAGGSGRQAGSAFKPFVLATALKEGVSPYRVYPAPGTIDVGGWRVSNYGGSSYGSQSLRSATVGSVNTVYAQLIMDVGPSDVADLARRMGIRSRLSPDGTLTLGTSEVTPLEMTAAYATLASGGVHRRPTPIARIEDARGHVVEELDRDGVRALPRDVAAQVTGILRDAVSYGTGTAARLPSVVVAGKTGTTDDHTDAWFCGYTAEVATCVWVGYPSGRIPMEGVQGVGAVTGGSLPALIWRAFMSAVPAPERDLDTAPGGTTGSSSSYVTTGPTGAPPERSEREERPPAPPPAGEVPAPAEKPAPPPEQPPPDDGGGGGGGLIPDLFPPSGG